MKQLFAVILCLCLLAGCGQASTGDKGSGDSPASSVAGSSGEKAAAAGELFRVIRSEDGAPLLLAKADGGPGDVYTLLMTVEPTLDGGSTAVMDLVYTPGTLLEVTYGSVLETYPGRLAEVTAVNIRSDGFDDRCALYLRVLNDLWAVDEGLNGDVSMISVDLSQTSLSESEQAAVAWVFGGMHDIPETMTMSYEELAAEGYLSDTDPEVDGIPHWRDGCLFTITEQGVQAAVTDAESENDGVAPLPNAEEESGTACQLPPAEAGQGQSDFCQPVNTESGEPNALQNTVTFDAQKWRSALGACFFCDCTSSQDRNGHWGDYTVGSVAIS